MKNYIVIDFPTLPLTEEEKQEIMGKLSPYFEKEKRIVSYYMDKRSFWVNESKEYEKLKFADWFKLHDTIFYCEVHDCEIRRDAMRTKYNHYTEEKQCVFFIKRENGFRIFCVRRVSGIMDGGDAINVYSYADESYHAVYGTMRINKVLSRGKKYREKSLIWKIK